MISSVGGGAMSEETTVKMIMLVLLIFNFEVYINFLTHSLYLIKVLSSLWKRCFGFVAWRWNCSTHWERWKHQRKMQQWSILCGRSVGGQTHLKRLKELTIQTNSNSKPVCRVERTNAFMSLKNERLDRKPGSRWMDGCQTELRGFSTHHSINGTNQGNSQFVNWSVSSL